MRVDKFRLLFFTAALSISAAHVIAQAPQGPPPSGAFGDSSSSVPVSATVYATTLVTNVDGGRSLNLLVLWRGTADWFVKGGSGGGGGGGGSTSVVRAVVRRGGLDLNVELQRQPRLVRIQSKEVSLQPADANVILVDQVDAPELKVAATFRIQPTMTDDRDLVPLLKQSPEIVKFLQCHLKSANASVQMLADRTCSALSEK